MEDKKKSILIVEDEAVPADNLKEALKEEGYTVVGICANGEEAVQKAEETKPDLILMDIMLQGEMDGVEATERIKEERMVPVIYLTAYSDEKILERAKITVPSDFIDKPFKTKDILRSIKSALSKNETKERVLLVDDNDFTSILLAEELRLAGFDVLIAKTLSEAIKIVESNNIIAAILDLWFQVGESSKIDPMDKRAAREGYRSGIVLANWIKREFPKTLLVGCSYEDSEESVDWFRKNGDGFLSKNRYEPCDVAGYISQVTGKTPPTGPKCFIVHGHDGEAKYQLMYYLQNTLGFQKPIILHEQPNLGRIILEKFEDEAKDVDIAFILLTPDDISSTSDTPKKEKRRARQNVIFEMGYFLAKFGRKRGRVILLHKEKIELPSDIAGLVYIDISDGIEAAGEEIRREVADFLPKTLR